MKILLKLQKIELMRFIGSTTFYFKFFDLFHVNKKPLYDLLNDKVKF